VNLKFSHSDAYWSLSGFKKFKKRLAACIGLDLKNMQHFGGKRSWGTVADDIALLLHWDCLTELPPAVCSAIAPRLKELVANWPDGHDRVNALRLADSMDLAAKHIEPLKCY
jgi:hypothetical protein